jgi:hypothetical protein
MKIVRSGLLAVLVLPVLVACGGGSSPTADAVDSARSGTASNSVGSDATPTDPDAELDIGAALAEPDSTIADAVPAPGSIEEIERVTSPIVRDKINTCEVTTLETLRDCVANASLYGGLDVKSDLSCSDDSCCHQNGALLTLRGVSDFTIHGNSHLIKRESGQRQCGLLEVRDSENIVVENWYLDDDISVPGCRVGDNCPRMVYVRDSGNITLDNVNVSNGKDYNVYIDGVEGFTFQNSSITNAGILGLYVGHGDNLSSEVVIEDSLFVDIETNAIALLGVGGNTTNVVRNNTFLRNHRHGHWDVAPKFGTGTTGGGQVYIARASNVLVEGNTILDGYCDNCYVSGGNRTGIHGIELGEPNRASLSNIEIRDNTIGNHDGSGIYLNEGNSIDSSIRISNNVLFNNTDGVQKKLYDNGATIGANDDRATAYFESFESTEVPGNNFSISDFCASESTVAKVCSGESLHGSCKVTLNLDGETCDDANVALESAWYQLIDGQRTAANGWVINGVSSGNDSAIGEWCLEFSDSGGVVTGIECRVIQANDSSVQSIHGLPSIDIEPPTGSSQVRWVARSRGSNPFGIDDLKLTGVR